MCSEVFRSVATCEPIGALSGESLSRNLFHKLQGDIKKIFDMCKFPWPACSQGSKYLGLLLSPADSGQDLCS